MGDVQPERGYPKPPRPIPWTIIPALPGTRIEWDAKWCEEGTIAVHAWLFPLDVEPKFNPKHPRDGEDTTRTDTSCILGRPMVLTSDNQLADARFADLEGTPGSVIEP